MIWNFVDGLKEIPIAICHFFRKIICKDYYMESHGIAMCGRSEGRCEWYWCPKRREDGEEE